MGAQKIPNPVIAVVADVLGTHYYNHTRLNTLFGEAGAPGDVPPGNCVRKCEQWLKACNTDSGVDAFGVLGRVLENFMELEDPVDPWDSSPSEASLRQKRVHDILAKYGLSYRQGGHILGVASGPVVKSLQELLRSKDLPTVEKEFERALGTVESDPPSGVTAACSLLESLFKVYIEDNGLSLPSKQTIGDLYRVVRDHLGLDPAQNADDDFKRILSGLISIVDGIGALRTHTGSAHGRGRQSYRLESYQARLALHAAQTLAVFVIENWFRRETEKGTRQS